MERIAILGGDLRNYHLHQVLRADYELVELLGFDALEPRFPFSESLLQSASVVVAPIPLSLDGDHINAPYSTSPVRLDRALSLIGSATTIVASGLGSTPMPLGPTVVDLYANEEFVLKTAIATAEGILEILIRESEITLHDADILVVGMGRVGSRAGRLLRELGARVTVATVEARERGLAFAEGFSVIACSELQESVGRFQFILNTVPWPYFTGAITERISRDAVFLDVASPPGALKDVDPDDMSCKFINARGIPGKTAPRTVARYMAIEIARILKRAGSAAECS